MDVELRNVGAGFVTWVVANPRTLEVAEDLAALLGAFPDELAPLLTALFQERSHNGNEHNAGASITFEF